LNTINEADYSFYLFQSQFYLTFLLYGYLSVVACFAIFVKGYLGLLD